MSLNPCPSQVLTVVPHVSLTALGDRNVSVRRNNARSVGVHFSYEQRVGVHLPDLMLLVCVSACERAWFVILSPKDVPCCMTDGRVCRCRGTGKYTEVG